MAASPSKPPRLAERLLSLLTDPAIRYSALGDFEERFCQLQKEKGRRKARLWYWWQIIRSVPSFLTDSIYWSITMLKNYLV
ncbi:permease prefix domain 2-containing transporter, partial [bacterium]|nr:permease prefix domain 2-containing transporter [bacterium]